jgi:hypothetical protein
MADNAGSVEPETIQALIARVHEIERSLSEVRLEIERLMTHVPPAEADDSEG